MMPSDTARSPKASRPDIEATKFRGNRPILPPPKGMSYPQTVSVPDIHQTTSSAQQEISSRSPDRVGHATSDTNAVINHDLAAPNPNSSTATPRLSVSLNPLNDLPDDDLAALLTGFKIPPQATAAFMSLPDAILPEHFRTTLDAFTRHRLYEQRRMKFGNGRYPVSEADVLDHPPNPIFDDNSVRDHDLAAVTGFKISPSEPGLVEYMANPEAELPDDLKARLDGDALKRLEEYRARGGPARRDLESRMYTKKEEKTIDQNFREALADPLGYGMSDRAEKSKVQDPAKSKSRTTFSARIRPVDTQDQNSHDQASKEPGDADADPSASNQNAQVHAGPDPSPQTPPLSTPPPQPLNLTVPLNNKQKPDYKKMKAMCDRGGKLGGGKDKLLNTPCANCCGDPYNSYYDFWPGCLLIKEFADFDEGKMCRTK